MTIQELKNILDQTGLSVVYSHFAPGTEPATPYIAYSVDGTANFMADNTVYKKITNVLIELYTDKKDLASEQLIENVLIANGLPFDSIEAYIESEKLYQTTYEVSVI